MKAEDHIIAWIESSGPHYKRLLEIHRRRQPECRDGFISETGVASSAILLVNAAYHEMSRGGDASRDDLYSGAELCRAAAMLCEWSAPE